MQNQEERLISEASEKELLQIAKQAVEAAVNKKKNPRISTSNEELQKNYGVFVTLTNQGILRGCLGRFESDKPLYETIALMAAASATQDSRFYGNPITTKELPQIEIKISLLSPLEKVNSPEEVIIGKHGIYITRGWSHGCYLPEVAADYNMSREEFLSSCCEGKAGLPKDAWRDQKTEIYVFTTHSFGKE
ncbi:MAG: AmmeMemoRadiSam system protein A [Planctomycetota bacterium]